MSHSRTLTAAGRRTTEDLPVKPCNRKKKEAGSALLVVLGFLSFMVVSAVAFAIYMRAERVPSSALRRNVATRHLVKAALAQAMSRVDDAIRADQFPGLANIKDLSNCYHDKEENAMDVWYGRVFMPPNPAGLVDDGGGTVRQANDPIDDKDKFAWRFAPVTETVSVLNLEALGYIPPPLVNDVRFLSRSTWTAKWHYFPFDAGRFAFCAVNVSDYLDVNRTKVGLRSSPLDSCISLLGTLSLTKKDGGYDMASDVSVDDFSNIFGPDATGRRKYSDVPYVSMLDYNLALGDQTYGNLVRSLFYPWIKDGGNGYFYGGTTLSSPGIQQAMRQPFVTDSFFAASNIAANANAIDYAKLEGQPFPDIDMSSSSLTLNEVAMGTSSKFLKTMYDKGLISMPDVPVLYDYLDHDDVPLSLAMPGVECVPMVTAVELVGNGLAKLQVMPGTPISDPASIPEKFSGTQTTKTPYKLAPSSFVSGAAGVRVLVAFPFRHFSGRNVNDFKVQVAMKVFVASGTVSVRPADGLKGLRPQDKTEWDQQSKAFTVDGKDPGDALAWSLYSNKVNVSIPNECKTQEDAVMKVDVMSWNGAADVPGDQDFFTIISKQEYENGISKGAPKPGYQLNLRPFKDGTLLPGGEQEGDVSTSAFAADEFKVYAMLWVRITDSSGNETYDLAPAVVADDMLNNRNNQAMYGEFFGSPDSSACLLFSADQSTSYTYANIVAGTLTGLAGEDRNWTSKSLAAVDPRYNYAPEDWFVWNESNIDGGKWLDKIQDPAYNYFGVNGRDVDIFMFTSNQGYLQSLGEFAFLPRLSEWRDTPGSRISPIIQNAPGASAAAVHAADPLTILNNACVWRTYPVDHDFYEDCTSIGIVRNSDNIQTVNPYSDNENVLMAAFANTPCDYWTTGRTLAGAKDLKDDLKAIVDKMGDKNQTSGDAIKDVDEALKHAFCEKNEDSSSRMKPQQIVELMQKVTSLLRSEEGENKSLTLEERYDKLPWFSGLDPKDDTSFENFMGAELNGCPLYSIDRKFLYSYWRECFANKQQLFLIFVRAESTALGGPGEGTPSQQGGRAVALVWREPTVYDDGTGSSLSLHRDSEDGWTKKYDYDSARERRPHRMRVLFYHQFD